MPNWKSKAFRRRTRHQKPPQSPKPPQVLLKNKNSMMFYEDYVWKIVLHYPRLPRKTTYEESCFYWGNGLCNVSEKGSHSAEQLSVLSTPALSNRKISMTQSGQTRLCRENTPPLCHVSPYSPPPLMLATARTPPMCLTKMSLDTLRNSEDSLIFQQLPTSPKTLPSTSK